MSKFFNNQSLNFKSHDWLEIQYMKQKITECKFHNTLLTVVE